MIAISRKTNIIILLQSELIIVFVLLDSPTCWYFKVYLLSLCTYKTIIWVHSVNPSMPARAETPGWSWMVTQPTRADADCWRKRWIRRATKLFQKLLWIKSSCYFNSSRTFFHYPMLLSCNIKILPQYRWYTASLCFR